MDYQLENLGPERFQEFCQALLLKTYPNLQCFPIGQRDGGRDAIAYYPRDARKEFAVFQIKYVRKPLAEADPHKWLTDIMAGELPKINELIKQGAKRYFLLTNVPGTAFPEYGSIDKVRKLLDEMVDIPSECWWRDELDRRLDDNWDLKWAYPELLNGQDMLRLVIESGLSEDKSRRTAAITAFIQAQYDIDSEVRFKQIDLQSKLLDLFIDVPISMRHGETGEGHRNFFMFRALMGNYYEDFPSRLNENDEEIVIEASEPLSYSSSDNAFIGASSLLLNSRFQQNLPLIVLEGAPGQGKSTITQYVCQVNRMRLLEEHEELELIPTYHRHGAIRLPLRVDLRDLATWLAGQNPFSLEEGSSVPLGRQKSLESFLAFLVSYFSGGTDFSVADLHAVMGLSAALIVLDGLDEVADIPTRRIVVEEVTAGVRRLKRVAASLQVIITSRPAAFANSPGFSEKLFPYFELTSITKKLIGEYTDKWIKARKVREREKLEIKKILKQKLDQPHLKDLARNPMQLSILLSLIHNQVLPDQRTALYDNYINLFFSRESDKNPVIQEHRSLLIGFHRYLAWLLHSESETGNNRGNIGEDRLKDILKNYLVNEDKDPALVDKIFSSMIERVVALVSRVQGTYEFEVQPLREYFAARYLYETAPYSPPGGRKRGTKPDRFDAIARNFYWLNVTRFFAGCFSVGELPSLVDRLQELATAEDYRCTSHPRVLAAMLLSDWVFEQHAKSRKQVVSLILDGLGLRYVLSSSNQRRSQTTPLVLPKEYGGAELIDRCFAILHEHPAPDYALEVIELVKANAKPDELRISWFKEMENCSGIERTKWLGYGLFMGLLSDLTHGQLEDMIADEPHDIRRLNIIFRTKHQVFCEASEQRCNIFLSAILSRDAVMRLEQKPFSILASLSQVLNPSRYAVAFRSADPTPLPYSWNWRVQHVSEISSQYLQKENLIPLLENCRSVILLGEEETQRTAREWATQLTPWSNIVEKSRKLFGEQWIHYHFANIACGIKSNSERCKEFGDLFNNEDSLCHRVRHARLRVNSLEWWRKQYSSVHDGNDIMLWLLVALTWASPNTIAELSDIIDHALIGLSSEDWHRLIISLKSSIGLSHTYMDNKPISFDTSTLLDNISDRFAVALGVRADDNLARHICLKCLYDYQGYDIDILKFLQKSVLVFASDDGADWNYYLSIISRCYAKGVAPEQFETRRFVHRPDTLALPFNIARMIAEHPENYPRYLVIDAEMKCREALASKISPVCDISREEEWFID